jgi:hypothetical protein
MAGDSNPGARRWTIYVCDCGYLSMTPGKCRSHPYPCRAMGPELTKVEVAPVGDDGDRSADALVDTAIQAFCDPGHFTKRGDNYEESLYDWQRRAVRIALAEKWQGS